MLQLPINQGARKEDCSGELSPPISTSEALLLFVHVALHSYFRYKARSSCKMMIYMGYSFKILGGGD
ncbi:hypothetical protein ACSS6W_009006 [Trichoderma asperelloides]